MNFFCIALELEALRQELASLKTELKKVEEEDAELKATAAKMVKERKNLDKKVELARKGVMAWEKKTCKISF